VIQTHVVLRFSKHCSIVYREEATCASVASEIAASAFER
jgi:hypothetical protein